MLFSGFPGVQDLSAGCPGGQDLSGGCPGQESRTWPGRRSLLGKSFSQFIFLFDESLHRENCRMEETLQTTKTGIDQLRKRLEEEKAQQQQEITRMEKQVAVFGVCSSQR